MAALKPEGMTFERGGHLPGRFIVLLHEKCGVA